LLFAVKNKKVVLFFLGLITLFFGYNLKNISFKHDLDSFFNKSNNEYAFSQDFFKQFGDGKQGYKNLIIGVKNKSKLTHSFLCKVDSLANLIKPLNGVENVHTITNQTLFVFTSFGRYPYKLFHLKDTSGFTKDIEVIKNYPEITSRYISKQNDVTLIYVPLNNSFNTDSIIKIKNKITGLSETFSFKEVLFFNSDLTGSIVIEKLKKESIVLTSISIVLVILILIFFFRSVKGVLIPLGVVLVCVVWILGLMSFLKVSLNVLTIAIPVIVAVISLSDVIHIVSRFTEEKEIDRYEKIKLTQRDMLKAIALTSLTTSFGFLSLIPSQIQVFIEFGFFTTIGVLFAFLLAYLLLPILIFHTDDLKVNDSLSKFIPHKIYTSKTLLVSFVVIVICILGVTKVKNDSYIYDDVNANDPASKSIKMLGEDFYGIRDLSIAITLRDTTKNILDYSLIKKIDKIQLLADSVYGLNNNTSLTSIIKQINKAKNGGQQDFFTLPYSEKEYKKTLKLLSKNSQYFDVNQFLSNNKKSTFIYSKIHDIGSYEIDKLNNVFNNLMDKNLGDIFKVTLTGGSHVLDQTNFSVTRTMFYSLITIVVLIFIIITILFKSIKIGLVSLLPNVLPLVVILAVVGWFDMGMSISTSIVFTIVFGIAVDDTIHFLSRYKIEKDKHKSIDEAINQTIKTSGGAISLTTIILVAGFGVLMFSGFKANFLTGAYVSLGLIVALISDLYLLPVMLNLFDRK
jgi:predicted RND superfamily exporter protein